MAFSNYPSIRPRERIDISAELGYVRMVPFSTRSKELPFPAPEAREGIEMPCGVLSKADRSDLDSLTPAKAPELQLAIPTTFAFCDDTLTRAGIVTPADGGDCGTSQTERQQ
jgi:hypothetical protein